LLDGYAYDLSQLPMPARLIKLGILNCRYPIEVLAKFAKLEDLTLVLDPTKAFDGILFEKDIFDLWPRLHTLRVVARNTYDTLKYLLQGAKCLTSIETLDFGSSSYFLEEADCYRIIEKFPNLQILTYPGSMNSRGMAALEAKGIMCVKGRS
jgi:hypothetical protein